MLAWILVGGRLTLTPALAALPRPALVVGADGGARHAAALGVGLDVWVGDFDSSAGLSLDAPREVHPAAKDQTDGELATCLALERGATLLAGGALIVLGVITAIIGGVLRTSSDR